jgi:hypothetical protein
MGLSAPRRSGCWAFTLSGWHPASGGCPDSPQPGKSLLAGTALGGLQGHPTKDSRGSRRRGCPAAQQPGRLQHPITMPQANLRRS